MSDTCEEDEAGEDRSGGRRAWRENRCLVYHVGFDVLIRIMEGEVRPEFPGFVELLEVVPCPHEARGLQIFVFSMDFDPVPEGDIIPYGRPMPVTPAGPGSWRDQPPML